MGFYSVLGFLRPAIFIFLIPIYTDYLTEDEYGMYGLMMDFALISNILVSFKLNTAMLTNYYDYVDDEALVKKFLSSNYTFSLLMGIVMAVVFWFLGPALFSLYNSDSLTFFPYGMTVVFFTVITEMNLNYIVYLKNKKNILKYSAVLLTQILGGVFFQVLFIVFLDRGLQGALEGIVLGNILVTILVVYFERYIIDFNINWSMVKASLKFSIPLMPYLLIYWFLTRSGKTFLVRETNTSVVALYNLLITIAGLVIFAVEAVINGIRPFLFEAFKRGGNDEDDQINLLTKMIINLPLLIVPVIIFIGTNINYIVSRESYYAIDQYMTFACFVMFVFVWARMFYQQLVFEKRSSWVTYLSFIAFIVLMVAFNILIPKYKIWGVLQATLLANIIMAVLFYFAAQKFLYIKYRFVNIIMVPLIIFGAIFLLEFLFKSNGWSLGLFGVVQLFLGLGLIVLFNLKNVGDYKRIFGNL